MVNINWQEIKEKCPKAYNKAISKLDYEKCIGISNGEKYILDSTCFCDILKFFDSVGIIINFDKCSDVFIEHWLYTMRIDKEEYYDESGYEYNSREEAQEAATIKAFEILNTMIEKGEIK